MKRQTTLLQAVIVLGGFLALAFLCNQSGIEIHLALFAAWFLEMDFPIRKWNMRSRKAFMTA